MSEFWSVLIAAATFATLAIGAVWAVMQAQLRAIADARKIREDCFEHDLTHIRQRIDTLEMIVVGKDVFDQFKEGHNQIVGVLREQLSVIETTRPTTGELRQAAQGLEGVIDKLDGRVSRLEQNTTVSTAAAAAAAAGKAA